MTTLVYRLLITYGFAAGFAYGQLYLIAGSPTQDNSMDTYASALFRIEDDGSVKLAAELVPQQVGTFWVGVSYDWRLAAILPKSQDRPLIVLDFDKAAVVKRCEILETPENSHMSQWLGDPPARGPSFMWDLYNSNVLGGMVLDPAVPCERSFATLSPLEAGDVSDHGVPGISEVVPGDGIRVHVDPKSGGIKTATVSQISLPYEAPAALRTGFTNAFPWVLVNDSHVLVLSLSRDETNYRLLAFRKSDKTWRVLPFSSERFPHVRGFGKFIAAIEVRTRSARNPESVGTSEWRRNPSKMGPTPHPSNDKEVYPGRLHLYDLDTERVYTITTDQGDSEVLLVQDDTVYYRASDRLYSAPITAKGIGPARLLAKGDAVRDSHWAFITHQVN